MHVSFRPILDGIGPHPARTRSAEGAVLLEVVLALALFVAAAAILTSGLSASLDSVERLRLNTHAADLAVSVFSELQLGTKTMGLGGPQPFEAPFEAWTWEAVATPLTMTAEETGPYQRVEVIVRHEDPALVYRLSQVVRLEPGKTGDEEKSLDVDSF